MHAADSVRPGARLDLEFADGRVAATADGDRSAETRAAKPATAEPKVTTPKRIAKAVDQGSLF